MLVDALDTRWNVARLQSASSLEVRGTWRRLITANYMQSVIALQVFCVTASRHEKRHFSLMILLKRITSGLCRSKNIPLTMLPALFGHESITRGYTLNVSHYKLVACFRLPLSRSISFSSLSLTVAARQLCVGYVQHNLCRVFAFSALCDAVPEAESTVCKTVYCVVLQARFSVAALASCTHSRIQNAVHPCVLLRSLVTVIWTTKYYVVWLPACIPVYSKNLLRIPVCAA